MGKFYCVIVEKEDQSYKYPDLESAKKEAEEIARRNGEGVKVYVLEEVAECEVPETPIAWK